MTRRWIPWTVALLALIIALFVGECRRARVLDQRGAAEGSRAIAEASALHTARLAAAQAERAKDLAIRLADAERHSHTLSEQLARAKRVAPESTVESVVSHTGEAFELPVTTDPSRTDVEHDVTTAPTGPVLQVHTTEARLRTQAGNIAVVGETVVECVGGACPLGWRHVDPWEVDATSLFVARQPTPLLRGWGIGLGAVCLLEYGCGWGPAAALPRRTWTVRGREVHLDGSISVSMMGEAGGSAIAVVRF